MEFFRKHFLGLQELSLGEIPEEENLQKLKMSLTEVKYLYVQYKEEYHKPCNITDYLRLSSLLKLSLKSKCEKHFCEKLLGVYPFEGSLTFKKYVYFISIVVRGDKEEVLKLWYDLFRKKNEMKLFLGMNEENTEKLEEILKFFFEDEKELNEEIYSKKVGVLEKSKDKSINYDRLMRGFNILDGKIKKIMNFPIKPCKKSGTIKVIQSVLERAAKISSFFKKYKEYHFVCRGGLLCKYEDEENDVPVDVIQLFGAKFYKVTYNNEVYYKLRNDFEKKTLYLKMDDREWVNCILFHILEGNGNKFNCFAPVRYNCNANWFVNGKPFYRRLAEVFASAKKEIFFSAWWVTPQIFLKRENPTLLDRFDFLLRKKAEEGVIIYFLIWNHNPFIGRLDAEYVAQTFSGYHPNFKVLLHPFEAVTYGHHQKMIVVDQTLGFQGGLDICFGRYDDYYHKLEDPCHCKQLWPGKDYWNPTIRTTDSVRFPHIDFIDRTREPRMGWHDVSMEVDGLGARDLSKNFVERWNNSRNMLISKQSNLTQQLVLQKNIPYLVLDEVNPPVYFNSHYPQLGRFKLKEYKLRKKIKHIKTTHRDDDITGEKQNDHSHHCTVLITRNLSTWSGSSKGDEDSLYRSWLYCIEKAEHYIFIEQQYFISDTAGLGVQNKVGSLIVEKVKWAVKNKKKFRVFIVFPLQADGDFYNDDIVRTIMFYNTQTSFASETSIVNSIKKACPDVNVDDYVSVWCLRNWGKINERLVTEQVYPHTKMMIVDDKYAVIGSANVYDRSFIGSRDSEISTLVKDNAKIKSKMNGEEYYASRFAYSLRHYIFNEYMGFEKDDLTLMDPISDESYKLIAGNAKNNMKILEEVFPYSPSNKFSSWERGKGKDFECDINPKLTKKEAEEMLKKTRGIVYDFPRKFISKELWAYFSEKIILLDPSVFQ